MIDPLCGNIFPIYVVANQGKTENLHVSKNNSRFLYTSSRFKYFDLWTHKNVPRNYLHPREMLQTDLLATFSGPALQIIVYGILSLKGIIYFSLRKT